MFFFAFLWHNPGSIINLFFCSYFFSNVSNSPLVQLSCVQVSQSNNEREENKKGHNLSPKSNNNESTATNLAPMKIAINVYQKIIEKKYSSQDLRETQEREYPFLDSDLQGMFDGFLKTRIIDLPTMKYPEETIK